MTAEIVRMIQLVRFPQEWGELWKRERERKPMRGERISIVRCALSPLKEVVARTPVDGSCVTRPVHQIEQHTSPQDSGKPVLRKCSTQTIRKRIQTNGHKQEREQNLPLPSIDPVHLLIRTPVHPFQLLLQYLGMLPGTEHQPHPVTGLPVAGNVPGAFRTDGKGHPIQPLCQKGIRPVAYGKLHLRLPARCRGG